MAITWQWRDAPLERSIRSSMAEISRVGQPTEIGIGVSYAVDGIEHGDSKYSLFRAASRRRLGAEVFTLIEHNDAGQHHYQYVPMDRMLLKDTRPLKYRDEWLAFNGLVTQLSRRFRP